MRLVVVVALALAAAGCGDSGSSAPEATSEAGAVAQLDTGLERNLQRALDERRSAGAVAGVQAAVMLDAADRPWTGTSGQAEVGRTVRADTLFAVGSVTKTITATLVMKLAEEDKLALEDKLSRWLPAYPRADQITVRMLLNHTSGISDFVESKEFWELVESGAKVRPEDALRYVGKPQFAPGAGYGYSNTNTLLTGLIIERAGSSYVGELDRVIRRPLGVEGEIFFPPEEPFPSDRLSHHYLDLDDDGERDDLTERGLPVGYQWSGPFAEGAAVATARGLARWAHALFAGELLSQESLAEMTAFEDVRANYDQGLGLHRGFFNGLETWGHHGLAGGFWAQVSYYPMLKTVVVVLANEGGPAKDTPTIETGLVEALRR